MCVCVDVVNVRGPGEPAVRQCVASLCESADEEGHIENRSPAVTRFLFFFLLVLEPRFSKFLVIDCVTANCAAEKLGGENRDLKLYRETRRFEAGPTKKEFNTCDGC